jgi:hypothetical protein
MNDTDPTPPQTPDRPPPAHPNGTPSRPTGCLTAFLVSVGVILLLPGLCTLVVSGGRPFTDGPGSEIATITFTIGFFGIALIWLALSRRRR